MVVELGYAEGWDLATRTPWRPLSAEAARERDAAGLPYAVLQRVPGRDVPAVVRHVSWRAGLVEVWAYDEQGRRTFEADLSLLADDDRLLNRRLISWRHPGPGTAESDPDCPRTVVEIDSDGAGRISHQPEGMRGSSLEAAVTITQEQRWSARPGFGAWQPLAPEEHLPEWVREHLATAGTPEGAAVWRREPSRMFSGEDFGVLFRPGTVMKSPYADEMTSVQPSPAGTLCVPSGLLAVSCPLDGDGPHFALVVPPGEHPLDEARAETTGGTQTTAVRVRLGEAPAVSWEMALRPGDDTRLLRAGEAYGFDTDGAMGAFADAGAWGPLRQRFRAAIEDRGDEGWTGHTGSAFFRRTREPASGAGLAAFALGSDGGHPVWVGRSADGDVVGVVVLVDGMPALAAP
ncbi:DUF4241 domain-containing protein [Streptomyces sp. NPDC058049]|uniref:DUF4241 domain-containing protein n=1 Tax=Streptomyces sp. NPDC058049 TaxID=3346314 RepID=UPI0036E3ABCF